jgi:hypothetical protein
MVTDLGEKPMPDTDPAEPPPGGVDAVEERLHDPDPVVPDLSSALNPHIEVPDPIVEGEDTDTAATSDDDPEPEEESPA